MIEKMGGYKKINYEGEEIHLMDLTDMSVNDKKQMKRITKEMEENIQSVSENSALVLINMKGMHFDTEMAEGLKKMAKNNAPYVNKSAIIGAGGLKKVLLMGMERFSNRKFKVFKKIEKAKNWLVKE